MGGALRAYTRFMQPVANTLTMGMTTREQPLPLDLPIVGRGPWNAAAALPPTESVGQAILDEGAGFAGNVTPFVPNSVLGGIPMAASHIAASAVPKALGVAGRLAAAAPVYVGASGVASGQPVAEQAKSAAMAPVDIPIHAVEGLKTALAAASDPNLSGAEKATRIGEGLQPLALLGIIPAIERGRPQTGQATGQPDMLVKQEVTKTGQQTGQAEPISEVPGVPTKLEATPPDPVEIVLRGLEETPKEVMPREVQTKAAEGQGPEGLLKPTVSGAAAEPPASFPAEQARAAPTETSESLTKKIDDLLDSGASVNDPRVEKLVAQRMPIDRAQYTEWREAAIKATGLPREIASKGIAAAGAMEPGTGGDVGHYLAHDNIQHNTKYDIERTLEKIYHAVADPKTNPYEVEFAIAGTAENPGIVVRKNNAREIDAEGMRRTQAVFNAIVEQIDPQRKVNLSGLIPKQSQSTRQPKQLPTPPPGAAPDAPIQKTAPGAVASHAAEPVESTRPLGSEDVLPGPKAPAQPGRTKSLNETIIEELGGESPHALMMKGPSTGVFGKIVNVLRKAERDISGRNLPAITRSNREAGEAGMRFASSGIEADAATPLHLEQVLPRQRRNQALRNRVGGFIAEDQLRAIKTMAESRADQLTTEAIEAKRDGKTALEEKLLAERKKQLEKAANVVSLVGQKGFPFKTEAEFQAAYGEKQIIDTIHRYREGPMKEYAENYRYGKDFPNDAEQPETRASHSKAGIYAPLVAIMPGETVSKWPFSGRGNVTAMRTKRAATTLEARGAHEEGYKIDLKDIIQKANEAGLRVANQRRFYEALVKAGDAEFGPPGETVTIKGEPGIYVEIKGQTHAPNKKGMYVRQSLYDEFRDVAMPDRPAHIPIATDVAHGANAFALAGFTDAYYHLKNMASRMIKTEGIGGDPIRRVIAATIPGAGPLGVGVEAFMRKAIRKALGTQASLEDAKFIAEIGSGRGKHVGSPETGVGKLISLPSRATGAVIHAADSVMRDVLLEAARGIGLKNKSDISNFIVENLGQYNSRLLGPMVRMSRETGIGPFAVAGTTMTRASIKDITLTPTARGQTIPHKILLRAEKAGKVLGWLAGVPMALNYTTTGNVFGRPGTPWGAVDTGKDNEDGSPLIYDLATIVGLRRGAKAIGLNAAARYAQGLVPKHQAIAEAAKSAMEATIHPFAGPLPEAGFTALTGKSLSADLYDRAKTAPTVDQQIVENVKAAVRGINPAGEAYQRGGFGEGWNAALKSQFPDAFPKVGATPEQHERRAAVKDYYQYRDFLEDKAREAKKMGGTIKQKRDFLMKAFEELPAEERGKLRGELRKHLFGLAADARRK